MSHLYVYGLFVDVDGCPGSRSMRAYICLPVCLPRAPSTYVRILQVLLDLEPCGVELIGDSAARCAVTTISIVDALVLALKV